MAAWEQADALIRDLIAHLARTERAKINEVNPATGTEGAKEHLTHNDEALRAVVKETMAIAMATTIAEAIKELSQAPNGPSSRRSWTHIAANGQRTNSSPLSTWENKILVPTRREREVFIRTQSNSPSLQRSPLEVVTTINQTLKSSEAIAARRLQSGNTLVPFAKTADVYKAADQ